MRYMHWFVVVYQTTSDQIDKFDFRIDIPYYCQQSL